MSIRYRWLRLSAGAKWPRGWQGRRLRRRLNRVGRDLRRTIVITSGQRDWRSQHAAYMDYLAGGTLAAPCCSKHYPHHLEDCLRQCQSNHCKGRAADCVIEQSDGTFLNIGDSRKARAAMTRRGLCLPVGDGEVWHVEVGNTWRS